MPKATLLKTFKCGKSAYLWNTVLIGLAYAGRLLIIFPLTMISPDEGYSNPPIILSVVVLPHPEGPSRVTNSLG